MKKVLLADDDSDYLFQMKTMLESMGFEVIPAYGQKDAEHILEELRPDLAILDLMMESEDSGFILAYKIKRKYPDVPVVIASAVVAETGIRFWDGSEDDKQWIRADLFLDKGIRYDQLRIEISRLIDMEE